MHIIGTAGHVDHGKSTLVYRLTQIDPDRLAEEKAREMTIDLGFAWLDLPNGETIGVIDMPGHHDFIENMLAGVGGIDAVLLVIAADEGVMPQTREHLAILDLLAIETGIIALTKSDLITDPEWLLLVQEEINDLLHGTCLANAPIIPVSAHTGDGINQLITSLQAILVRQSPRPDYGQPRLFIDRAFSIKGFGTVVTGTLLDGKLQVGDEIVIEPNGLHGRIRGLQSYQNPITTAYPGTRVAINIAGVNKDEIYRGQVVCRTGYLAPSTLIDAHFRYLPSAKWPLKHHSLVKLFCGSAEVTAHVRLLGADHLNPGESGWIQLHLERPTIAIRGDRFILRRASPPETIGGGIVIDAHPPKRWRRFRPEIIAQLELKRFGSLSEQLTQIANVSEPIKDTQLQQRSGLSQTQFDTALAEARQNGWIIPINEQHYWSASQYTHAKRRILTELKAYHKAEPLRLGMPREALRSRVGLKQTTLTHLLNDMEEVLVTGNLVKLKEHYIQLNSKQQSAADQLITQMLEQRYTPPSFTTASQLIGEALLYALIDLGEIVYLQDDVIFARAVYDEMVTEILDIIAQKGTVSVKSLRDRFNTSRKYAIALLEHLDALGITRRIGDERVLGNRTASRPE